MCYTNLSSLWARYERDKKLARYSDKTLSSQKIQNNLLIKTFGDIEAGSISTDQLKDYLASCDHLKTSSLGHRIRVLKAFFTWAYKEQLIDSNPMATIREPVIKDKTPKFFGDKEIVQLKSGCQSPLEKAILEFSFATGCRIGEIWLINHSDINWEDNSVNILGKGGKRRVVYFSEVCKDILNDYIESRKDDDPALFVTERAPHRMSISQMRYILKRIAKRSGIKGNAYPHKLRHSYATHLINNGASLEAIRQLLGHSSLNSTLIYASLTEEGKKNTYTRCFKE